MTWNSIALRGARSGRAGGTGWALRAAAVWALVLLGRCCGESDWLTSYDAAMEAAREQGKPVLTIFTGSDWCPHCRTLEEQVLHTRSFEDWADGRVILLVIDLPQQGISAEERASRSKVCIRYGVRTFPSAVLIGTDGARLTAQTGYLGQPADTWVASFEGHLEPRQIADNPVVPASQRR